MTLKIYITGNSIRIGTSVTVFQGMYQPHPVVGNTQAKKKNKQVPRCLESFWKTILVANKQPEDMNMSLQNRL